MGSTRRRRARVDEEGARANARGEAARGARGQARRASSRRADDGIARRGGRGRRARAEARVGEGEGEEAGSTALFLDSLVRIISAPTEVMMVNSLVLLPRVLHVLGLDQDLWRGVDGEAEHGSRRVASRAALLALASPPPVLADAPSPALLALASPPPVLADLRAPALLAAASLPPVLADARAPALLALASPPPVLADAPSPALLALASPPPVLADARAPALLALGSLPPVLADPLPRALLAQVPSFGLPVRARRTSGSFRHPRARSLAKIREHGVVFPRGAM